MAVVVERNDSTYQVAVFRLSCHGTGHRYTVGGAHSHFYCILGSINLGGGKPPVATQVAGEMSAHPSNKVSVPCRVLTSLTMCAIF